MIEVHSLLIVDELVAKIHIDKDKKLVRETGKFDTSMLTNEYYYFKLIEDKIDIQNIEEINACFIENSYSGGDVKLLARKCNELLKAVKQLDKKTDK